MRLASPRDVVAKFVSLRFPRLIEVRTKSSFWIPLALIPVFILPTPAFASSLDRDQEFIEVMSEVAVMTHSAIIETYGEDITSTLSFDGRIVNDDFWRLSIGGVYLDELDINIEFEGQRNLIWSGGSFRSVGRIGSDSWSASGHYAHPETMFEEAVFELDFQIAAMDGQVRNSADRHREPIGPRNDYIDPNSGKRHIEQVVAQWNTDGNGNQVPGTRDWKFEGIREADGPGVTAHVVNGWPEESSLSGSYSHGTRTFFGSLVPIVDPVPGDLVYDQQLNALDIDLLSLAIRSAAPISRFDLNRSGRVEEQDLDMMIRDLIGTSYGDTNLDGRFDSSDLVEAFQCNQYESDAIQHVGWKCGDWDGDGRFASSDLILAFQEGTYESLKGTPSVAPEPNSLFLTFMGVLTLAWSRHHRVR